MKRIMLVVSLIMALTAASAAPHHTFYFLVGQPMVNVEFDYNQVHFETNMNDAEIANFRKAYQGTWETLFVRELNEELEDARIRAKQGAQTEYTIRVIPTKATKYGFTRATVMFFDKQGTAIKSLHIRTDKDAHNTLSDTYIDSMKELGEELGDIMEDGL